jgi:hypothetical protein
VRQPLLACIYLSGYAGMSQWRGSHARAFLMDISSVEAQAHILCMADKSMCMTLYFCTLEVLAVL